MSANKTAKPEPAAATVVNFGLLSALAIFIAFVFDVFLSPALLTLIYRSEERS